MTMQSLTWSTNDEKAMRVDLLYDEPGIKITEDEFPEAKFPEAAGRDFWSQPATRYMLLAAMCVTSVTFVASYIVLSHDVQLK